MVINLSYSYFKVPSQLGNTALQLYVNITSQVCVTYKELLLTFVDDCKTFRPILTSLFGKNRHRQLR